MAKQTDKTTFYFYDNVSLLNEEQQLNTYIKEKRTTSIIIYKTIFLSDFFNVMIALRNT